MEDDSDEKNNDRSCCIKTKTIDSYLIDHENENKKAKDTKKCVIK